MKFFKNDRTGITYRTDGAGAWWRWNPPGSPGMPLVGPDGSPWVPLPKDGADAMQRAVTLGADIDVNPSTDPES